MNSLLGSLGIHLKYVMTMGKAQNMTIVECKFKILKVSWSLMINDDGGSILRVVVNLKGEIYAAF